MFEEMQHSIVGQHMADLMREAAEARQDRELRQATRPTTRPILVRLGHALAAIGRIIGGESRGTTEPPRSLKPDRAPEPCADRTPRDVARAA